MAMKIYGVCGQNIDINMYLYIPNPTLKKSVPNQVERQKWNTKRCIFGTHPNPLILLGFSTKNQKNGTPFGRFLEHHLAVFWNTICLFSGTCWHIHFKLINVSMSFTNLFSMSDLRGVLDDDEMMVKNEWGTFLFDDMMDVKKNGGRIRWWVHEMGWWMWFFLVIWRVKKWCVKNGYGGSYP